jgi:hypothetical protein
MSRNMNIPFIQASSFLQEIIEIKNISNVELVAKCIFTYRLLLYFYILYSVYHSESNFTQAYAFLHLLGNYFDDCFKTFY